MSIAPIVHYILNQNIRREVQSMLSLTWRLKSPCHGKIVMNDRKKNKES